MADAKTTALNALTTVALADILPIVDDVAGTPETKKVTVEDLLEVINVLTAEASIDGAADFLLVYDTTATGVRKVLPDNLPVANHAASKITSGTLAHERGGLEADVSAYDGLLRITAGATSAVTVTSFALTVLDDADAATLRATIGAASSAEVAALTSGYARRAGVIARVDNTAAPPTEVSGDRYLLDAIGASHGDWDGAAANDIVEFDGASWVATTPIEGWIVYSDGSDTDWLFIDDGSPAWQERTAGGGVTDHGALTGLSDDDHSIYSLADGSRWTTTQTASRVAVSDGSGNLVVSSVTTTTLAYLDATSSVQTQLDGKSATGHGHTSGDVSDFAEAVDARVAALLAEGTGITLTYDDGANTLTIDADGGSGGGSGGGLTVTAKTAGYTAANGDLVVCDATGGSFNVTMPASPTTDDRIGVYLEDATASITVQGNGKTLGEFGSAITLSTAGEFVVFQYDGVKWIVTASGGDIVSHERGGLEVDVSAYAGVPLIDSGTTSELKYNLTATTDPGVGEDSDDGYSIGSRWINVTLDKEFVCLDSTVGAAVWTETTAAGGGSGGADCCLAVAKKTANYTAAAGDLVVCDSSGGSFTVTMPAAPTADDVIGIYLEDGNFTLNVTVQGNGKTLAEFGSSLVLHGPGELVTFQYDGVKWVTVGQNGGPLVDNKDHFFAAADATKKLRFNLASITTATTRTLTVPDASGTIALTSDLTSMLEAIDIDTIAELNALVTDATLVVTTDSRLSDARTPTAHASSHTNGTDDIQNATAAQKGLATAAQIAKLDGLTDPPWLYGPRTAGEYLLPATTGTIAAASVALAANNLYAVPIVVYETHTYDQIACYVNSTGTATNARVGIFTSVSGLPSAKVLDAGTVDVSFTGIKSITISEELTPGVYWLVIVADGTVTMKSIHADNLVATFGTQAINSSSTYNQIYCSHTYGVLPSSFGTVLISNSGMPTLGLRF